MTSKKLLIIGFVWPEPKSSAAGSRMMQLIETFQSQDYQITFASTCAKTQNAFNLETIGIEQVAIELNNASFDDFIKRLSPDIVIFDRFMVEEQFGWRVMEHCPNALRILDTEDLHCLRKGREEALKKKVLFDKGHLFSDIAKREIASIYRCDIALVISEEEMNLLENQFKIDSNLLHYLPFLMDVVSPEFQKSLPTFNERTHFVMIGNFLHAPNYDAVLFLKEHIWPLIRKQLSNAQVHIYGAYATNKVLKLSNEENGFVIRGFANEVEKVMRSAKVCLAPLRFGAGLKGKLVDAMVNGTPSVMTDIAAEGMFGAMEPSGFIANTPEAFASKAVELYTDKRIWEDKQKNGFHTINTRFNKDHFLMELISKIDTVQSKLHEHRLDNFIGAMLQHHTMQSTKYMSKWIEVKNSRH